MAVKILYITNGLNTGGTEKQLGLLIENLPKDKFKPLIFSFLSTGSKEVKSSTVYYGFQSFDSSLFFNLFTLVLNILFLLGIIIRFRPKIIHSFLPKSNIIATILGRLTFRKKIICSWRGLPSYRSKYGLSKFLDKIILKLSHFNTYNSMRVYKSVWKSIFNQRSDKNIVIYNGYELPASSHLTRKNLELKNDEIAICHVANLIPYKGHEDLIRALDYLRNTHPELKWKLYLFGQDRGIQKNLEDLARQEKIFDKIYFLGQCQDVHNYLPAMDIGVLPSHEEGFSNALIEKLAAGLPVIATNIGGNPEALEGLENCFLVPPHNPRELAEALAKLIKIVASKKDNPQKRANYIKDKYTVEKMINSYIKLYESKL